MLRPNTAMKVDEHLVTLLHRSSREGEQYKTLRYALETSPQGDRLQVIAVTSPCVGDGKTTTAINLAGVLAHRPNARVLLVDVDLRRPSVAALLGLTGQDDQAGLVDAVLDPRLTLDAVVTHLPAFNLRVLQAGRLADDPCELLRMPRMGALLEEARRQYDAVILDTAPFLLVPDSRLLENCVDGFLLVVAAHRTPRKPLEETLNLLRPSKLVGLVFNRDDDRPLSQQYGYYYDGYAYSARPLLRKTRGQ